MNINTVKPLDQLLGFIDSVHAESSGSSSGHWHCERWRYELDKAVPDWHSQVKRSQSWTQLSAIKPQRAYAGLCELLLEVAGFGLAKIWVTTQP